MKLRLTGATFDASAKTVTHASFSDITLAGIQLIVNVTDQVIIYNFADTTKGGTLSTDTLTLEYDTTTMSDTDELMILVENGASTVTIAGTVELGATDNAVLDAIASSVAAIDTDTTTIIGHVDGIETLVGTTNTTLSTIDGRVDGIEGLLTTIDADTSNLSVVGGGLEATALRVTIANDSTGVVSIDDNGGAITVDGTVAVTNAGITTIAGAVAGTEMQVDVLTMPTVTVDLGLNNDVTVTGTVDLGATDNAVLDAIEADTTIIAGAVSAAHMQTDIVGALPAGAAVIGQVSINQTTPGTTNLVALSAETTKVIGTVRVASGGIASGAIASGAIASGAIASGAIAAGAIAAGATSIATTEDTASAAADHLVKIAAIRRDTPVANDNTSNDGDYTQLKLDNFGKLWTSGSAPEDVAHVAGEALTIGGVRRIDTPATSAGTSGDWATMDASAEGALWTTNTPTTTGGCTIFRSIDLDESEEEIKATAGNLYGYYFFNSAATTHYLKFYNATAASVSVGTTTPVLTFPLPAGGAGHISFGFPVGFSTAICAAVTTGLADADTGAPAANAVILNAFYK